MRWVIPVKASIEVEKCIDTNKCMVSPPQNSSSCLSGIKTGIYHAVIKSQQKMRCPLAIELILFCRGAMAKNW